MITIKKLEKLYWSMFIGSLILFWILEQVNPIAALIPAITCIIGIIGITILPDTNDKSDQHTQN